MCIIPFISLVGITNHVVTTISAFSFIMLLLDRILTLIVNRISNTSYHLQYLYYPGGNETGAKPNLITCITEIFLSAVNHCSVNYTKFPLFKTAAHTLSSIDKDNISILAHIFQCCGTHQSPTL